jgi:hypothetical protein
LDDAEPVGLPDGIIRDVTREMSAVIVMYVVSIDRVEEVIGLS